TPGRILAATVDPKLNDPPEPALFTSSDRGSSWSVESSRLPSPFTSLVIDPSRPAIVYAVSNGFGLHGFFRSIDGGQRYVFPNLIESTQVLADPLRPDRLYLTAPGTGVQTSADGGRTWSNMNSGLTDSSVTALALDGSGGYLYAATNSGVFAF